MIGWHTYVDIVLNSIICLCALYGVSEHYKFTYSCTIQDVNVHEQHAIE